MRLRNVKKTIGYFSIGMIFIWGCQDPQNPFTQEEKTSFNFIDEKNPGESVWRINIDDTLKLRVAEKQLKYIDSIVIDIDSGTKIVHVKDPNNYAWEDTFTVDHLFDTSGEKVIVGSIYRDGKAIEKDTIKIFVEGIYLDVETYGGGTVSPSGSRKVKKGSTTDISATPVTHYHFVEWLRSGPEATLTDSLQPSTGVILTASATVAAVFSLDVFDVIVMNLGPGTATTDPPQTSVRYGDLTLIVARADTGYHFVEWTRSGLEATISDSTLWMTTVVFTGPATLTAKFAINSYNLTVSSAGNGTVSPLGSSMVNYSIQTSITATPATGYHFVKWTRSGSAATIGDSTQASTTVVLKGSSTVTAVFANTNFSLTVSSGANGTVSPAGSSTVGYGVSTPITATPNTGYHFVRWTRSSMEATIGDTTQAVTTVALTGDAAILGVFAIDSFSLIISNNGNGTVTPSGSSDVEYAVSTSIVATPNTGHHFLKWIRNSVAATIADSTEASTTVALTGNATVTGVFEIDSYVLTDSSAGNGTVSPSGTTSVNYGASTSITATPNTGYHFVRWTRSGLEATIGDSAQASTSVILTKSAAVIAVFEIDTFTLVDSSAGNGTVSPSGSIIVEYGVQTPISATPLTNYHFVKWMRSGLIASISDSTLSTTSVILTGPATVTAIFAIDTYTLIDSSAGNGTVSPAGSSTVDYGALAAITATPNTGYHFVKWTRSGPEAAIEDSTLASTRVALSGNATVMAIFTINNYFLNISSGGNGYVSPFGGFWLNYGDSMAVSVTPWTGYHFVKWSRNNTNVTISDSTKSSITVILKGNANIGATCLSDTNTITVSSGGNGIVSPTGQNKVDYRDSISITATPNIGYHFVNWTRSGTGALLKDSTRSSTTVVLTGSATVTANFAINTYTLTVSTFGGGNISPYGSRTVDHGASTAISATPNTGYHFVEWQRDDTTATIGDSTQSSTTVVLTGSATVTALFSMNYYDLTMAISGSGTTSPSGTSSVRHGTLTLINATASSGYHFTGWTTSDTTVKISSPTLSMTTLTLTGPATVTANFAINTYSLTVSSSGNGTTNPTGTSTVNYGEVTPIIATSDSGYTFVKWTRSSTAAAISDSTQASTGVFLTGNATVTAIFQ
jgi:uncharacterized repeat protein (TIGR02543 family)